MSIAARIASRAPPSRIVLTLFYADKHPSGCTTCKSVKHRTIVRRTTDQRRVEDPVFGPLPTPADLAIVGAVSWSRRRPPGTPRADTVLGRTLRDTGSQE